MVLKAWLLLFCCFFVLISAKGRGGSRGGSSRGGSKSWGSKAKSKATSFFGGSKKKTNSNPYKSGGYPKQSGGKGFNSYKSGGQTVSNSNWPKNQIPAAGTFPKANTFSNSGGMNKMTGMGTMGAYGAAGGLKNTMKSKGMYKTAVGLGTAYVGYKVAKGVGKTIGSAMWMGYPRIYGTQSHFYGMGSSYRYMGATNRDCDVFYDIMKQREVLRCDDWDNNRYNNGGRGMGGTIMGIATGLFWMMLIGCCCCCGCGYMFIKKSKKKSRNPDHTQTEQEMDEEPMNFQQPPPMMEPHNPYPKNDYAENSYPQQNNFQQNPYPSAVPATAPYGANPYPAPMGGNPYPTGNISAPPAAYPDPNQAPNYANQINPAPPAYGAPGGVPMAGM